ncbi:hypothetical protein LCGC14_0800940 [marine sediment metagenome]|uniref:EamA domain-containing protein n=1 Tax=marine sediment metagenome TaxID=412755 RepID=A0A0F9PU83_9ZZZZ
MQHRSLSGGILLLLAATLSWGGMFPIAKPALAVIDPYYLTLIRYLLAAIIFFIVLSIVEGKLSLGFEGKFLTLLLLSTLGFSGFNLLAFNGLMHSKPEHGAVIIAMMPMITVLLNWLIHSQRPASFTMFTILTAFFGVFLVVTTGDPVNAFSGGKLLWDFLFLAGAFCWVAYTMGASAFPNWSSLRYTSLSSILGALSLSIITLFLTAIDYISVPSIDLLVSLHWTIFYLVVMGALVAVLSWNIGIKLLGAVNGVLFINFVPITAFAIGIIQGKEFNAAELTGAACVIGSLIANNLFLRKQQKFNNAA